MCRANAERTGDPRRDELLLLLLLLGEQSKDAFHELQPFKKWLGSINSLPYLSPDAHANENRLISASDFVWGKVFKPHEVT